MKDNTTNEALLALDLKFKLKSEPYSWGLRW